MGTDAKTKEKPKKAKEKRQKDFAGDFERAVDRARWYGYAERLWDKGMPTLGGLTATFLAASWSGLVWTDMPPAMRVAGVALFGVAAIASALPLTKIKKPTRREALDRLDAANGKNRPATTYDDIPADAAGMDEQSRAVWDLERRRIERKVGKFKAGLPQSGLKKHDPYALRFALALVTGLTLFNAVQHDEQFDRVAKAFDWKIEAPYAGPPMIDAWVRAPSYTGQAPIFIASKDDPSSFESGEFNVPARSVLSVALHEKNVRITTNGTEMSVEEACRGPSNGALKRCEFQLTGDTTITIRRGGEAPMSWYFNVTADLPPRITINPVEQDPNRTRGRDNIEIEYEIEDEYGAEIKEIEIQPAQQPDGGQKDPDAEPLSLYRVPNITIPNR